MIKNRQIWEVYVEDINGTIVGKIVRDNFILGHINMDMGEFEEFKAIFKGKVVYKEDDSYNALNSYLDQDDGDQAK